MEKKKEARNCLNMNPLDDKGIFFWGQVAIEHDVCPLWRLTHQVRFFFLFSSPTPALPSDQLRGHQLHWCCWTSRCLCEPKALGHPEMFPLWCYSYTLASLCLADSLVPHLRSTAADGSPDLRCAQCTPGRSAPFLRRMLPGRPKSRPPLYTRVGERCSPTT